VLVVDGIVAFTGGIGFADKWNGHAQDKDHWRDSQMRIEGPLVARFQEAFQEHWVKEAHEALSGAGQFPPLAPAGDVKAQVVTSHSFSMAPVPLVQAISWAAAEHRICITNAYCTPTNDQVASLVKAVQRGVDVKILLPGPNNDQPMTKSAGRAAYGKLLEGGVKIFEYQPAMIHEKCMVIDGLFTLFGSSNLDARSSEINEELDVAVYDAGFAAEQERSFENDLRSAREYTLDEFNRRSMWERVSEWIFLPFRSQM
jgi:cardiolipin synthase